MSGLFVQIACPDCAHVGMNKREGLYGKYLACQVSGCQGRRKVTEDWVPLDRPEDSATRRARQSAHRAFDPLWQTAERMYDETMRPKKARKLTRARAYQWLAAQLGKPVEETHMELFTWAECERTVVLCRGMTCEAIREWTHARRETTGATKDEPV